MAFSECFSGYFKFIFALMVAVVIAIFSASEARADTTLASWYGPGFSGNPTASGETYDPYGYTAAHKTLPLGTSITVNYGGRSVDLVVNDRGPYVGDRELDLSQGAAQYLGLDQAGVDYVDYTVNDYAASAEAPAATTGYESYPEQSVDEQSVDVYAEGSVQVDQSVQSTGAGGAYTVQAGDTLNEISSGLGASVDDLAAANGLSNPNVLSVGQTLYY